MTGLSTVLQGAAVCCVCVCVLTASSQHRDQHIPLQLEQHKCQSLLFLFESLLWQRWLLRLQMVSETRVDLDPQNKFMNSQT